MHMASSRIPFFPCKWGWYTDVFSTRIALTQHLREHPREYKPIKRRDCVAALLVSPGSALPMLPSLTCPDLHLSPTSDAQSPHAPCIEPSKLHDHTRSPALDPRPKSDPANPANPSLPSTDVLISQLGEPRQRECPCNPASSRPAISRTARMRTSHVDQAPAVLHQKQYNIRSLLFALLFPARSMLPEPVLRRRPGTVHASAILTGVPSVPESPVFPSVINSSEDDSTQTFPRKLNTQPPLDHANHDALLW
ncbi:hypothetical protein BOTBODRAFT_189798 [Botryobasidium botryosum FD-172 SS1]|uniref:Uncharacterized protein n=1 Tax=Botryobasidium botryosum (strain FD-172 SS1) TaxID=930990 RepID=A0A067MJ78_BOTB1|nr:hypothetical protein BOTBODRAFT_189798 [Botryobasidium botryosum FD-172 SS1]